MDEELADDTGEDTPRTGKNQIDNQNVIIERRMKDAFNR
jgi:hypothetical protein